MKALSIRGDYALEILLGEKTEEYRTWTTKYRGPLLICSTAEKISGTISGHALCVTEVTSIKKLRDGTFAWQLGNVQYIKPFSVKGQQRLYNVPDERIHYLNLPTIYPVRRKILAKKELIKEHYEPLTN